MRFILYNLAPADSLERRRAAAREVRAMLATKPHVLGLNECIGYDLPVIDGYHLFRNLGKPGRANIAAYVNSDLKLPLWRARWHDLRQTWSRTQHDGTHPPRSWLEFRVDGVQVLVGHQPPRFTDNVEASQQEGINLLRRRMGPWLRPSWRLVVGKKRELARGRVVLADFNRAPWTEGGPGPGTLAAAIGGHTVGSRIDCAVVRRMTATSAEYFATVGGLRLGSDHKEAFRFEAVPYS